MKNRLDVVESVLMTELERLVDEHLSHDQIEELQKAIKKLRKHLKKYGDRKHLI